MLLGSLSLLFAGFLLTDVDWSPGCQVPQAKLLQTKGVHVQLESLFFHDSHFS